VATSAASNEFEFLVAAARRSIEDLRRSVAAVQSQPGGRGSHFLGVVDETLNALDRAVSDRESDFAATVDDTDRRAVIGAMRTINHNVMGFHSITPWVESTLGSDLALGLIYFVDEMVKGLLQTPADVVITPNTDYMYTVRHRPFEQALRALGVTYPGTVSPLVIEYPIQEPASLFLHLIVGHEIGHAVVTENALDDEVFSRDPDQAQTQGLLQTAVQEYESVESQPPAVARARIAATLRSWVTELLCDHLAFGFLGPSFLLTAAVFSTPFGGPEPSETHPPFTLRTRLLMERVDSWNWRPTLEASIPATFGWVEAGGQVPQEVGVRTYFLRLEEVIDALSTTIAQVVDDHLSANRFEPTAYDSSATELRDLLTHGVLPAQLRDQSAADHRSLVLAGWLEALTQSGDDPGALPGIVGDRELQGFLTKSLEMSAVLDRWQRL
jgi:hypothetical protein